MKTAIQLIKQDYKKASRAIFRTGKNILYFYQTKANAKTGTGAGVSIFSRAQFETLSKDIFNPAYTDTNCLSCPLRDGRCYTFKGNMARGLKSQLNAIRRRYNAFSDIPVIIEREAIPEIVYRIAEGKYFRFGVYGCPTAVPLGWVEEIVSISSSHTGYTHEWQKDYNWGYSQFFMASVHTKEEAFLAEALGWRYFMAVLENEIPSNAINCPASKEAGYRTTCNKCKLCGGARKRAKNIYILKH